MTSVAKISLAGAFVPLFAALCLALFLPAPAGAMETFVRPAGDTDALTIRLENTDPTSARVRRTGREAVSITFPPGVWTREARPTAARYSNARVISGISATEAGLNISTKGPAFGYIAMPSPGNNEVVVRFFRDPLGAKWGQQPTAPAPEPQRATRQPASAAKPAPAAKPARQTATPPRQADQPKPASGQAASPERADVEPPQAAQKPAATLPEIPPAQPNAAAPTGNAAQEQTGGQSAEDQQVPPPVLSDNGGRKAFFSVPYSVRAEVQKGGREAAVQLETVAPQQGQDGEMRFTAVNKGPEEVRLAEAARPAPRPEPPAPAPAASVGDEAVSGAQPPSAQAEGVSGDAEMSSASDGTDVAPTADASSAPPATGEVAVSAPQVKPSQVVQELPGMVRAPVMKINASEQMASAGDELPTVIDEQDVPPVEEVPPSEQTMAALEDLPGEDTANVEPGEFVTPAEEQAPDVDVEALREKPKEELTDSEKELLRKKNLQEKYFQAKSSLVNGDLETARTAFEEVLSQPGLPGDLREDALYSLGETLMQFYRDTPAEHFEEISSAFLEAMNANTESPRVPDALINLGLLNLKVNNIPEATAYFSILRQKFPNNQNIPYIGYYWGEYYFNKGDYRRAADQFQDLIQKYPDNAQAQAASWMLLQSLARLGYDEQAYQIADYMNKRWPLYFVDNPSFLKLTADIEYGLDKDQDAKDHYWTYYNLDPEVEGADIVLARIGDIYLAEGKTQAAREIYEKAIKDFPDREGGLVSMMRLAEEGIFDDPTLQGMVSVFDRPYSRRPQEAYEHIVQNFPDSRLAPLAQLKLAMWYYWNKNYGESLAAVQDYLDRWPDGPLADRARELGDKTFALAVPDLVRDENYRRVVDYWESYGFVDQLDSPVSDTTRMDVAYSYMQLGEHDKAFDLLQRFLGEKQVPKLSETAVDMAVNMWVEERAWSKISDLVDRVTRDWTLSPRQKRQLDYARAMALENLGKTDEARDLWNKLAADTEVRPAARAYAMYYLAKDAMNRQDLRRVFAFSQEALDLLLQSDGDREKIKDCLLMSIYATERSGRYPEALKWALEYDRYIPEEDPEWPAARFKLAQLYRKAGSLTEWKKLMDEIQQKKPDTIYARLAASAVETYDLEQQADQFSPMN